MQIGERDARDNIRIDVSNILELALQLFPYDEAEFLDTLREVIPHETEKPQYNYSLIRIVKKKKKRKQK